MPLDLLGRSVPGGVGLSHDHSNDDRSLAWDDLIFAHTALAAAERMQAELVGTPRAGDFDPEVAQARQAGRDAALALVATRP